MDHFLTLSDISMVFGGRGGFRALDSISLNQIFRRMITALKTAGDDKGALGIGRRMLEAYRRRSLKPHVLAEIERQRDEALGGPTLA